MDTSFGFSSNMAFGTHEKKIKKTKQKIKESFQKEHKRASELVEDPKRSE